MLETKRRKSSRVGDGFQAKVARLAQRRRISSRNHSSNTVDPSTTAPAVECVWDPSKLDESSVLKYLQDTKYILPKPFRIAQDHALSVLSHHKYDCKRALAVLSGELEKRSADSHPLDLNLVFEVADDFVCFICRDFGDLLVCDLDDCRRVFHTECLEMDKVPNGIWECPIHFCKVCSQRIDTNEIFPCLLCASSYCSQHGLSNSSAQRSSNASSLLCDECAEQTAADPLVFFRHLSSFHRMIRNPVAKFPSINKDPLGLFELYQQVLGRGGYSKVEEDTLEWMDIAETLGLQEPSATQLHELREMYVTYLSRYEELFSKFSWTLDDTKRIKRQRLVKQKTYK